MKNILPKFLRNLGKNTKDGKKSDSQPNGCENTKPNTEDSSYELKIKKVKITNIKVK